MSLLFTWTRTRRSETDNFLFLNIQDEQPQLFLSARQQRRNIFEIPVVVESKGERQRMLGYLFIITSRF